MLQPAIDFLMAPVVMHRYDIMLAMVLFVFSAVDLVKFLLRK